VVLSQTHTAFGEGEEKGKAVFAGGVGPLVVRSVIELFQPFRCRWQASLLSAGGGVAGRAACGPLGSGLGFAQSHSDLRFRFTKSWSFFTFFFF